MIKISWPIDASRGKCCHDVLAMLSGKLVKEIVELSKTIGLGGDRMSSPCIRVACRKLGIKTGEWEIYRGWKYVGNPFPVNCIICTWLNDGENIELQGHVILRIDNVYYDPFHWGRKLYQFPVNQMPTTYLEILEE